MKPWLTDIRKTALVAAVGTVVASAIPMRPAIQNLAATLMRVPWIIIPVLAFIGLLFAASTLGFLVALWHSNVQLRISRNLRCLALFAAGANALDWLWRLFRWVQFYWTQSQRPTAISATATVLDSLGVAAYILFLVAMFRHAGDATISGTGNDRLLRQVARISVVYLGLVLAYFAVGVAYLMVQYTYFQELAFRNLREFPSLGSLLTEPARAILRFSLLWVPPFIIHRSLRVKREVAEIPPESV